MNPRRGDHIPRRGDHHDRGHHDAADPRRPGPDGVSVETTLDHFEKLAARIEQAALEAERETGRHETSAQDTQRSLLKRVGIIVGGSVVLLLGLVLLVLPGPGLVVVAVGLGILASEVPFAHRVLEKVRRRLPSDADGKLPKSAIAMMVGATAAATAGSTWWALR